MNSMLFWLLAAGHLATDFYANFLPALLPVMVDNLHISLASAGFVITATSVTANLFQPFIGYIFDRRPSRVWLVAALLLSSIFMCLAGSMPSYALFLLFPVLSGLGNGIFHPAGSAYTYLISEDKKGFLISVFASLGFLGFAVAPMIAAYVIDIKGLGALVYLMIPGLLLAAAFVFINFNERLAVANDNREEGTGQVVFTKAFIVLTLIMILRAWGNMVFSNYLPLFMKGRGYTYTFAETMLTIFLVFGAVGGIIGSTISDRIGRKKVILYTLFASSLCAALFMLTDGPVSLIFLALCGLLIQAAQPVMVVLSQEMMPNNIGLASGVSMGFVWGVGALGVFVNGWVADHAGLAICFWLAVAILFLSALLTLLVATARQAEPVKTRL